MRRDRRGVRLAAFSPAALRKIRFRRKAAIVHPAPDQRLDGRHGTGCTGPGVAREKAAVRKEEEGRALGGREGELTLTPGSPSIGARPDRDHAEARQSRGRDADTFEQTSDMLGSTLGEVDREGNGSKIEGG